MQKSAAFVNDTLNDGLRHVSDYVDVPAARELLQHYQAERSDATCQTVFDLATLILWIKE